MGAFLDVSQKAFMKTEATAVTAVYRNKKLEALYRRLNRRYFGGRLPKGVVIGYRRKSGRFFAKSNIDGPWIWIANKLRTWARQPEWLLLHEMAHFSVDLAGVKAKDRTPGMHSRAWDAEMLRLANLGAFRRLW